MWTDLSARLGWCVSGESHADAACLSDLCDDVSGGGGAHNPGDGVACGEVAGVPEVRPPWW